MCIRDSPNTAAGRAAVRGRPRRAAVAVTALRAPFLLLQQRPLPPVETVALGAENVQQSSEEQEHGDAHCHVHEDEIDRVQGQWEGHLCRCALSYLEFKNNNRTGKNMQIININPFIAMMSLKKTTT